MIKIIDDFLEDTEYLDWLYNYFKYVGSYQFDFMPKSYVNKAVDLEPMSITGLPPKKAEDVLCYIIKKFCASELSYTGAGFEPWVNVLDMHNDHLNYHVDCDEQKNEVVPAKLTATLHIGSGADMEGGELAINVNPYTTDENETFVYDTIFDLKKDLDNDWIIIPYRCNRLIMFDSILPHAVLPIKKITPNECRVSFTATCWDKKIKVRK